MAEMSIKKQRPKNLDITSIRLPLPGKVSILHRVSGAGIFLMLPLLLWIFQSSVTSPESFEVFKAVAGHPLAKLVLAGLIWAYMHHFCAGIRFLLLDVHVGVELQPARQSAAAVLAVSLVLTAVLWGVLLW
ncbi:succinate dehydrogenase, cytochrome b556 subunit [Azovibrio restrictus]|uniref:succinate dehydrogenase, cytochrome b556 subunit n=1 Tax=Azovibrio restrictus TaxID=146938 RepID=UPI0026F310AF|nr:succinate dehydrogenase, cytochrome b556 subunit [Azovibrio restrictus]MDD3481340.1 succinate dehydrogenase, cytochrome b556 subunit [Azovibrio restrictus]